MPIVVSRTRWRLPNPLRSHSSLQTALKHARRAQITRFSACLRYTLQNLPPLTTRYWASRHSRTPHIVARRTHGRPGGESPATAEGLGPPESPERQTMLRSIPETARLPGRPRRIVADWVETKRITCLTVASDTNPCCDSRIHVQFSVTPNDSRNV